MVGCEYHHLMSNFPLDSVGMEVDSPPFFLAKINVTLFQNEVPQLNSALATDADLRALRVATEESEVW